ncbi:hypothetical protein COCON_G00173140 [Conger conger]|uniref:Uncharacterized protein n=1 Tax=Conger conger TaxID=82655 RepID=A0A9Q1D4U7_CONCO|nr:hypothetical protein COCON_G00173140 [Conger conger]
MGWAFGFSRHCMSLLKTEDSRGLLSECVCREYPMTLAVQLLLVFAVCARVSRYACAPATILRVPRGLRDGRVQECKNGKYEVCLLLRSESILKTWLLVTVRLSNLMFRLRFGWKWRC